MARYPQGQSVRLTATIRDATNSLVNANSTLITLRHAAITTTYTSPTNDGLGQYHLDVPGADITTTDHYEWVWDALIGSSHALVTGNFDVFDPFEVTVLSLSDAKDALNIPAATTTYDTELAGYLAGLETNLERLIGGPIVTRPVTERVTAGTGWDTLAVRQRPLVAVTAIVDISTGASMSLTDLEIDSNAGIIRRRWRYPFVSFGRDFMVTYTAGLGTAVPAAFNTAARMILADWWATQRGESSTRQFGALDESALPQQTRLGIGNHQAIELLSPYLLEVAI